MSDFTADPSNQCIGKACHKNKAGAMQQCRSANDALIAYRCPHCKGWHVGHDIARVAKRQHFGIPHRRRYKNKPEH